MTIWDAAIQLRKNPGRLLIQRWNWKSALFSSITRAGVFFVANLSAGWRAATGAMLAELGYRALTAGFYGALTQAFREAEPEWAAAIATTLLLPVVSHAAELGVHLLRGTPKLYTSIAVSAVFTVVSTQFNLYAMRRGALVVGAKADSTRTDIRRLPGLIAGFAAAGPLALYGWVRRLPRRPEGGWLALPASKDL